ncbi:MAG: hypothetical protein ACP5R5_02455 [Armatimonadota bacterium]
MMKVEKKQTVQLAVLGVLVVGCVGYLSFSLMAPGAPAKNRTSPAAVSGKNSSSGDKHAAEAEADISAAAETSNTDTNTVSLSSPRDPFIPQKLPVGEMCASAPASRTPRNMPKLFPVIKNSIARVPPIEVKPLNPFGAQRVVDSSPQPSGEEKQEPEEDIAVTGVVRGENNVAILRIGSTGRHVVREGQTIDGRYQVVSVTGDGAVLAYKDRHIPVKLGGVKNAK